MKLAFTNARLIDPETDTDIHGGLTVEDGHISDMGPHLADTATTGAEIIDCQGDVLAPGLIDTPMVSLEGDARNNFYSNATADNLIPRAGTPDEVAHPRYVEAALQAQGQEARARVHDRAHLRRRGHRLRGLVRL